MKDKIRPVDPRALNDLDNATEDTKNYHSMNTARHAMELAERYKHSPVYLKLLSDHIRELANKAYDKHLRALESGKPKKRDPESGQFTSDGLFNND